MKRKQPKQKLKNLMLVEKSATEVAKETHEAPEAAAEEIAKKEIPAEVLNKPLRRLNTLLQQ